MTISFPDPAPIDIQIERQVDQAILDGWPLPRWGWAIPGPYQGSTGAERVLGWQKMRIAEMMGLLERRLECSGCGAQAHHRHQEIYQRSLFCPAVCRSCHYRIHKRFMRPVEWSEFLQREVLEQSWLWCLPESPLNRAEALRIAASTDLLTALQLHASDRKADRKDRS